MNLIRTQLGNAAAGVGVVDTPDELAQIQTQTCAAAIWRRQPCPEFQAWIDALDPSQLPSARLILRPEAVREAVQHVCDIAGMEETSERIWLVDDITDLAARFANIMHAPYLRLRLDVINTNACRKFHVDAIIARLICTYRGTGTQYGVSKDGADPSQVFTVATTAPMVMHGTRWPEAPRSGFVHRSPPIAGTGETRLVLVLDPIFDVDEAD